MKSDNISEALATQWLGPEGMPLQSGGDITIVITMDGNTIESRLTFDPLLHAHSWKYTCDVEIVAIAIRRNVTHIVTVPGVCVCVCACVRACVRA